MSEYPCPLCQSNCEWFSDCPGYVRGGTVMVCGGFYDAQTTTGKEEMASRCGNAALWLCSNLECDWAYREPNRRGDYKDSIRPEWMFDPWGETKRKIDEAEIA